MMFKSKEKAMVTFADGSGHVESIQIIYNPASVSYERLFEVFGKILIRLIQTVNSVK
jgi:peptide methionine sulfoxide reductase MsrA